MMKKKHLPILVMLGIFIGSAAGSAHAQDEGEWDFMLAPLFLWGMSIDGETALDGNTADLALDFSDDIFENMETAFTFHFEARKGDLLLFAEYQYVNLTPGVDTAVGPVSINADIDFTVQNAELGAGYVLSRSDAVLWEVLGGLRWNDHDLDVDVDVSAPFPPLLPDNISGGDDWVHPFVGGRVITSFANNWKFIARGDVAYGGSDDKAYQVIAMVDYQFKDWGSVFGGYRHMDFDYDGGSYAYDATQRGPILGLAFFW